jgi:hypothetical protein
MSVPSEGRAASKPATEAKLCTFCAQSAARHLPF